MASITIQQGHKNLIFAHLIANEMGAEVKEEGQWITISSSPQLEISRYCFDQAVDPGGQRARQGDPRLESMWRSLLLNKRGHLIHFDDFEIVIADEKPDERPQFLLRFPDAATKAAAEEWATRAGFASLTEYILEAVAAFNEFWSEKAQLQ